MFARGIWQIWKNIEGLFSGSVDATQLLKEENILPNIHAAMDFGFADFVVTMANSTFAFEKTMWMDDLGGRWQFDPR